MSATRKEVEYVDSNRSYVFRCPHCDCYTLVAENEINCQIFVHGIIKSTYKQVNPHADRKHCERLLEQGLVHGCCGQFKLFRGISGEVEYADVWNNG